MCCCQIAVAVAHLLPVLNSSCLCFVAPKQGPDSGPRNGATILKLIAQLPNLWPQFWAHDICVWPSAKSALSCDRLHLSFMFSCAWCQDAGFTCRARSEGRQKACRPTAKNGVFCSKHARLNFDCHKQRKTCVQPAAVYRTLGATPAPPDIKVDLLPRFAKQLHQKRQQLVFVSGNVDSWGAGPYLRAHIHIHHAEAALNN